MFMTITGHLISVPVGDSSPLIIHVLLHNTVNEYLTKISGQL